MHECRGSDLVLERLHTSCDSILANSLYSTWTKLVQFGEKQSKDTISKRTFYRHKKMLIKLGISWHQTKLNLQQFSIVPDDFSFTNNKYVDNTVSEEVLKLLASVS